MRAIENLRIGTRLAIGFGALLLCSVVLLGLGLLQAQRLQTSAEELVTKDAAQLSAALEMREASWAMALALRKASTPTDASEGEREIARIASLASVYAAAESRLRATVSDAQGLALLDETKAHSRIVMATVEKVAQVAATGSFFDAAAILGQQFQPQHDRWVGKLVSLADQAKANMDKRFLKAHNEYVMLRKGLVAAGLLVILAGAFISVLVARTITTPLGRATRIADKIAHGDFSPQIDSNARDETGQLLRSLKRMQENLSATVSQIMGSAQTVTLAAGEISIGNADLSSRTESQAGSLQETASAMAELTLAVVTSARHTVHATQLAGHAVEQAREGGRAVDSVVETMGEIGASSKRVADITGVISAIAFQTNILSLNAAVEAARAGESGRGFAVVAAEVRELAQKTAAAADQIKIHIAESVRNVQTGSKLVDTAGARMRDIVTSVHSVAEVIEAISTMSQSQSAGIQQISTAFTSIDAMTQQNAALVEQAAAAAESLREQAAQLELSVSAFKFGSASTPRNAAPAARAAIETRRGELRLMAR